jgi:microcystin-dependent protein
MYFGTETVPSGWLECNGSTLYVSDYPELYAYIGNKFGGTINSTFKIPDLRQRFIRGFDKGRGLDPNRSMGYVSISGMFIIDGVALNGYNGQEFQEKMLNQHRHWVSGTTLNNRDYSNTGGTYEEYGVIADAGGSSTTDRNSSVGRNVRDTGTPGTYGTKPRNLVLMPCIKY